MSVRACSGNFAWGGRDSGYDPIGRPTTDGKGAELWTVTPKGTIAAQATATLT